MWSNIGKVEENKNNMEFLPAGSRRNSLAGGMPQNEALYVYADCHSAMKGIFTGNFIP